MGIYWARQKLGTTQVSLLSNRWQYQCVIVLQWRSHSVYHYAGEELIDLHQQTYGQKRA